MVPAAGSVVSPSVGALGAVAATASGAAFIVGFSIFVVGGVVLSVLTFRWAVGRDRAGRAQWLARREGQEDAATGSGAPPPDPESTGGT